jgi:hypothetical protein
VVLHSHEIHKSKSDFAQLLVPETRAAFQERITAVMREAEFTLIAAVINKEQLVRRYAQPNDPYEIALAFCIERLQMFLQERSQTDRQTHLLVECRRKAENDKLELEFRQICDGANRVGALPNLGIPFVDKKHNSPGLQLADLVAYPVGRHVLKPDQPNRAYEVVERKFQQSSAGRIPSYGLKLFP